MIFVTRASTTMLRRLCMGVLIILILHPAIGSSMEYPVFPRSMEDYEGSKSISAEEGVIFEFDSVENMIYDENVYPAKELERIIDETMELLESGDEEEQMKLKINPSDYGKYKRLRNMRISGTTGQKSGRVVGGTNGDDRCPTIIRDDTPKVLTDISGSENWILNVNNMKQTVYGRTCVKNGQPCGEEHTNPYSYRYVCKQLTVHVPLFSIPVDQEIVKENQVLREYKFQSNCVCKMEEIK